MAKISTYGNDATISATDKILGTDAVDSATKNYTVGSLDTFFTTTTQTLQNKTMDFSSGGNNTLTADAGDIIYDNSSSGLDASDTNTAIDELASDIDTLESGKQDVLSEGAFVDGDKTKLNNTFIKTTDDTDDITEGANKFITAALKTQITTNQSNIADLQFNAGTALTTDTNLSSLTADEYSLTDSAGATSIVIDDAANALLGNFEHRWVHVIVTAGGITVSTSGSQSVEGTTTISTSGSYRFTKIATNSWMLSKG